MNEDTLILTENRLLSRLFDGALTLLAWGIYVFLLCQFASLFTILCKCFFLKVAVKAVTKLDNKAAHCHSPVPQWHCPFL
ncbi:hypothetical protein Q0T19_22750 [Escherichia coli O120:H1]|nr:hypothetical protein [Escherichia coli]CAD5782543.1 hemin storage system protein [Escherichia coli]CAD5794383.1 hemin storage system protein [Escherichia coli]